MMEEICQHDLCTGCSACAQICPVHCISMQPDPEGFLRPVIETEQCVGCNRCQKVCPVNHPPKDDGIVPQAFAAKHMDDQIRKLSSSGGVFSALAEAVLSQKGAVIAAGFDEGFHVVHKVCTDQNLLDDLRRSKYVQSDINGMFVEARQRLEKGQQVLFCGTPCQIGGLKAYLGKEYPGLYTVDFICHGVPSPWIWQKYLRFREQKIGVAARQVSFRSKITGWRHFSMEFLFSDGTHYSSTVDKDPYLRSFIMDMDLRPSCNQCMFKQAHRQADITLADFWGVDNAAPSLNDDNGVSLVLVHSEKGNSLIQAIKNDVALTPVDFEQAVQSNPSLTKSVCKPPLREHFMKDSHKLSFDRLHEKYCGTSFLSRLRRRTSKLKSEILKNE